MEQKRSSGRARRGLFYDVPSPQVIDRQIDLKSYVFYNSSCDIVPLQQIKSLKMYFSSVQSLARSTSWNWAGLESWTPATSRPDLPSVEAAARTL